MSLKTTISTNNTHLNQLVVNSFREFSYEFLGTSGTSEGYGFYFTDSDKVASGYSEGGQIYRVNH